MKGQNLPLVYLNTASVGLISPESVSAAERFLHDSINNSSNAFMTWMEDALPELRKETAALMTASTSEIAFTPNFSFSLLAVIQSISPKLRKVLLYKDDYPSLNLPFELSGFDVYHVETKDGFAISLSDIMDMAKREKIEIIAISHVQFLTGFRIDLVALGNFCRENNIVLIVDATQSMGAVELSFNSLPVDVLISSSYKWLNGGTGSAVLLIKESFMERFPPRFGGFGSMKHSNQDWSYFPSILSYEPGHLNASGLLQLQQSVKQRLQQTVSGVEKHNRGLIKRLASALSDTPFDPLGGNTAQDLSTILCFKAGESIFDRLHENQIFVTRRKGYIRVSPHFYNTEGDIDRLIEVLKDRERSSGF